MLLFAIGCVCLLFAVFCAGLLVAGRATGIMVCRRCKFDVSGISHAQPCPECGHDLAKRRGVTPRVTRSKWLIAFFAFMLLTGLTTSGFATRSYLQFITAAANIDRAPEWLLRWSLRSSSLVTVQAALDEATTRVVAGSLSKDTAKAIIKRIVPADPARVLAGVDTDAFVAAARTDGVVADATLVTYYTRVIDVDLRARTVLRSGKRLPVDINVDGGPFAVPRLTGQPILTRFFPLRQQLKDHFSLVRVVVSINGKQMRELDEESASNLVVYSNELFIPCDAPPGKATVRVVLHFQLTPKASSTSTFELSAEADFTIVPSHAADYETYTAFATGTISPSISVASIDRRDGPVVDGKRIAATPGKMLIAIAFDATLPPSEYDVFLVPNTLPRTEHYVRTVKVRWPSLEAANKREGTAALGSFNEVLLSPEFDLSSVDLILRSPPRECCDETVDIRTFWQGPDIVHKNVKVPESSLAIPK